MACSPLSGSAADVARKFELLQERAARRNYRETSSDSRGADSAVTDVSSKKANIGQLKEFYLQKLSRGDALSPRRSGASSSRAFSPRLAAKLAASSSSSARRSNGASSSSYVSNGNEAHKDAEELDILCNTCLTLMKVSEAQNHWCGGKANGAACGGRMELLDGKLGSLRSALEVRIQASGDNVNVLRHLTQLQYHIDTAAKWTAGSADLGPLSDHTVQQVKQLTATSRHLAPAVHILSKRIESLIVQKERAATGTRSTSASASTAQSFPAKQRPIAQSLGSEQIPIGRASRSPAGSVVRGMDSDCGTQYAETLITQTEPAPDVGNINDANEYLSLKSEDQQRRWFYSQTLSAKLACRDKESARKILISDLYSKVRSEKVPFANWSQWIQQQLEPATAASSSNAPAAASGSRPASAASGARLAPASEPTGMAKTVAKDGPAMSWSPPASVAKGSGPGSQAARTQASQDGTSADIANVQDANDCLALKDEDEQRRWFYAQTLNTKLAIGNQAKSRNILISDLYSKVRSEKIPVESWSQWIRAQLMPDDASSLSTAAVPSGVSSKSSEVLHSARHAEDSGLMKSPDFDQIMGKVPQVSSFSPPLRA